MQDRSAERTAPELVITRDEFARWHAEVLARVWTEGITYRITDHSESVTHLRPPEEPGGGVPLATLRAALPAEAAPPANPGWYAEWQRARDADIRGADIAALLDTTEDQDEGADNRTAMESVTAYLLRSPANARKLLASIEKLERGGGRGEALPDEGDDNQTDTGTERAAELPPRLTEDQHWDLVTGAAWVKPSRTLTVLLTRNGEFFNATCAENDVASYGETITEAVDNITEALQLTLSETDPDVRWFQLTIVGNVLVRAEVPYAP